MNNPDKYEKLDRTLSEFTARKTAVRRLREKSKQKPAVDDMTFQAELEKNWWLYVLLFLSSAFTGTLGIYMGLSPTRTETGMYFYTDFAHLVLAAVYCVAFITVTEFAFGLAKWLYFTREERNAAQQWSMLIMMGVAGISILGTGIAGGMVIASNIAFLTDYMEVPHQAQTWVVVAIPTLITAYAVLGSVYVLSSEEAAAKRLVRETERENQLEHETQKKLIKQWGDLQVQKAEALKYIELVEKGAMTAGEAQAAIRADETLGQTERRLGRDLDGDGTIGHGFSPNGQRERVYAQDAEDMDPLPPPR